MKRTPLAIVLSTVLIALIGLGIVIPLLPVYINRFGGTGFEVGLMMMIYPLVQFLLAPLAGRLSDKIGRRPVLIISLLITTVSYILFAFSNSIFLLFISRILAGIGGADVTVAQAYIADVTTRRERARGMGLFGAAYGVGFVAGPILGGTLAPFGVMVAPLVAAGLAAATTLFALFALPEPDKREVAAHPSIGILGSLRENRDLTRWSVLNFLFVYSQSQVFSMIVLFTVNRFNWAEQENGYLMGLMGIVSAVVQALLIEVISRRHGSHPLILIGIFLASTGMFLIGMSNGLPMLVLGAALNSLGFAAVLPSLTSMASLTVKGNQQGQMLGIFQSAGGLGGILAPLTGGIAFDLLSPSAPFITGTIIGIGSLVFSHRFIVRSGRSHLRSMKKP